MMNSQSYWQKRLEDVSNDIFDDEYPSVQIAMRSLYLRIHGKIAAEVKKILDESMDNDGNVSIANTYKFNSMHRFHTRLKEIVKELETGENKLNHHIMTGAYKMGVENTSTILGINFKVVPVEQIQEAIMTNWSGEHFSSRIWKNTTELATRIDTLVTETIATGRSKDRAVNLLEKEFGVGFSKADRIVRTETMAVINRAQFKVYTDAGYAEYVFLSKRDSRTSKVCNELDKQIFKFKEAKMGSNYPPIHTNCRSTIVPKIEE